MAALARIAALTLGLAACGPASDAEPAAIDPGRLPGTSWVVTHVGDRPVSHEAGTCRVTLTFGKDRSFGGQGPINNYGANYRVRDSLIVADGISQNLMGATDPEITARERDMFAALTRPFRLQPTPTGALLVDAAGRPGLRLRTSSGEDCAHAR
ncbi:MAG TPA: META domain-containing protein [Sphingomonadaceae bacterium]|nr:META domain-containing protein [Sphingomonadaceae bacterium]